MDEPSRVEFDWLTLDDAERVLWSGQPHVYSIVPALVVGIPLSLLLVGIPIVVGSYLNRENTHYVLTTDALYQKRGIFSRSVRKIAFEKIQNTSYSQGALGKHFGYGNVDISTAGGSGVEMQFGSVPDPKGVQERINRRIRQARGPRDEHENEESSAEVLDEILAELRAIRTALDAEGGTVTERQGNSSQSERREQTGRRARGDRADGSGE
ncbi:PH domain-containing protein [Halorientalis litorea]|jgi:uncharacterized membrane protein YdbT with pleckstrin-like domain|uniref:PH domain-containing protein n=1 Tax=Halorientalis litorea TaxID=2931977 RepID=UPI001FF46CC1|nr:PH domain-containing protein [Halorientalis litorea]